MPKPLVEDDWVDSYAKSLLSGEMQMKLDAEPSTDLAQALQEWTPGMRLLNDASVCL